MLNIVADTEMFAEAVDRLAGHIRELDGTHVASIEARGWLLGLTVARAAQVGFIPIVWRTAQGPRKRTAAGRRRPAAKSKSSRVAGLVAPARWGHCFGSTALTSKKAESF